MPCKGNKNARGEKMNIYNYFDAFALIVWAYLFADALSEIKKGRKDLSVKLRLSIGLGGFIIDLLLVLFGPI